MLPYKKPTLKTRHYIYGAMLLLFVAVLGTYYHVNHFQVKNQPDNAQQNSAVSATWSQDFSTMPDGPLPTNVWGYNLDPITPTYNNELQAYTNSPQNTRIDHGALVIQAIKASSTYANDKKVYPYTSGRIDTKDTFSFTYGKLEADMKLPSGAGAWPAFWLLSANEPYTAGKTPGPNDNQDRYYMKDGEVDIVEGYGGTLVEGTLHTYAKSSQKSLSIPDATTAFHRYSIEISPSRITWAVDGHAYYSIDKSSNDPNVWPFQNGNKFYPILNLAIGGTSGGTPDPTIASWQLQVRSIKFYPPAK